MSCGPTLPVLSAALPVSAKCSETWGRSAAACLRFFFSLRQDLYSQLYAMQCYQPNKHQRHLLLQTLGIAVQDQTLITQLQTSFLFLKVFRCQLWAIGKPSSNNPRHKQIRKYTSMKITVFRDVAPCILVEIYRHFTGSSCLHHRGERQSAHCNTSEDIVILAAVRT